MKKQAKKGFTIVELVIVIALIAILAAVLIPTFSNVINNAHESSDTMMVKNLNTILNAEEVNGNRAETMQEAVDQAEEGGYKVDKLTPTSSGDIVWDQESNRFLLINAKKEVVYKDESATGDVDLTNGAYKLWKITHDATKEDKGYSLYLANGAVAPAGAVEVGVDAGVNENVAVNFKSAAARDVIIRTNGGTLNVDAANATVSHYGEAEKVVITAVAGNSYHEYGKVVGNIEIAKGRVEVNAKAEVGTIIVKSVAAGDVKVEVVTGATVKAVAPATEAAKTDVTAATGVADNVKHEEIVTNTDKFAGGLGTEASPYLIANEEQLVNINELSATDNVYVRLINNIVVPYEKLAKIQWTGHNWYTYCAIENFNGVFDGAGYEITLPGGTYFNEETSAAYSTLINTARAVKVKNLILTQGTLLNDSYNVTVEKVTTRGDLSFQNNCGMIIGNAFNKATLIDCRNEANINSTSYSAVFVGYAVNNLDLTFTNCVNAGSYVGVKSSMFLGNIPSPTIKVKVTVTNCGNVESGLIRTTETAPSYKWNSYVSTFSEEDNITLIVNNAEVSLNNVLSSGFVQGPNDSLAISKNEDNTFTIAKSNIDTVSYYIVNVSIYSKSVKGTGTQIFSVEEKIDATSTLTTTVKYLAFTMEDYKAAGNLCGWEIVSNNGTDFYKFDKNGYTISNGTKPNVSVVAYDANGNVLSSATLKK